MNRIGIETLNASMFTGIIEATGVIKAIHCSDSDRRLVIRTDDIDPAEMDIGDSLAVSGVCLSLVNRTAHGVDVDVSVETLRCTTLGDLREGDRVNLERALKLEHRLGGHLVSGHVDGVGTVVGLQTEGESLQLQIQAPRDLARYLCSKGSICVDGVSLTVNTIEGAEFTVNLIPHTRAMTTLDALQRGDHVNLEVDMIARYLERLLTASGRL